jgi:predicted  nucleic acid-binding Zn-ribbon protein
MNKRLSLGTQTAFFMQGHFMIDEKVKIKCTKCAQVFRERAQRIRDGLQTNCVHCNRLITFDNNSDDRNIRKALMAAKEIRLAIDAQRKAASQEQAAQAPIVPRSQY